MSTEHSLSNITGGHTNAVSGGAAGFMSGTDKAKLDAVAANASAVVYFWGVVAAPANVSARFFLRTGATVASAFTGGTYPVHVSGLRTVTLIWNVSGTPLATDSVTLTLFVNGVASALTATIAPSTVSGQASTTITFSVGDNVSVRTVQTATEAQAAWNGSVSVAIG